MSFSTSERLLNTPRLLSAINYSYEKKICMVISEPAVVGSHWLSANRTAAKEGVSIISFHNYNFSDKGHQDSVKLSVLRAKSFKTGKASIALNPPAVVGLNLSIKQLLAQPDDYVVYFFASADAKPGEYNFVPTCTLRNKSKGIILKVIIK